MIVTAIYGRSFDILTTKKKKKLVVLQMWSPLFHYRHGKAAVVVSCSMYSALPADDTQMYARFGIADGRSPSAER